jgi:FkbM family methyltransferase
MNSHNKKRLYLFRKIKTILTKPDAVIAKLCQLYLDAYNGFSYDFYKNGEYQLLLKLSKLDFKTIFDVGSNVGDWALAAKKSFPSSTIHCFEVSSKTYRTLSERLKGSYFIVNNIGLADKCGVFEYKDYGENSGFNTILLNVTCHDKSIPPQLVQGILCSGDIYCAERNIDVIDFLKIDVEGAEHLVLKGFSNLLQKQLIRVIQFEYGYANGDAKFLMKDFFELLKGYGYQIGKVRNGKINFTDWTYQYNDFNSGPNYVAVKKVDSEVISTLSK